MVKRKTVKKAVKKTAKKNVIKTKKITKKNTVKSKPVKKINKKVKPVKKKNKSKVEIKKPMDMVTLISVVLLVIVLLIATYLFLFPGYKYVFDYEGVRYYSNDFTPTMFFTSFSQEEKVFVSPVLEENNADPAVANAMNLWLVALNAEDKNAIQLIRVNVDNELSMCYTNDGDVNSIRELSVQECKEVFHNNDNAIVLIEEGTESVVISKNRLLVKYSKTTDIGRLNYRVIERIFPNIEENLKRVNAAISWIG